MKTQAILALLFALVIIPMAGVTASGASLRPAAEDAMEDTAARIPPRGLFKRIIAYFDDANKPKSNKRFDMSFIGGPHYSSDTQLGLGLVASGTYRHTMADTLSQPSVVALYGDVSTVGFYLLGIRGTHVFTADRNRLDYNVYFYSFPTHFWGIGYDMAKRSENKTKFKQFSFRTSVNFLHRFAPGLFAGPGAEFNRVSAKNVKNQHLWLDESLSTTALGVGAKVQFDTRDNMTAPQRGWLVTLEQKFCPRFLGNDYAFSFTAFRASHYRAVWRGGVVAGVVNARFAYGRVPWSMLSTFGGSNTMRGYYEGRYRDKDEIDLTLELRQHVWHRIGVAAWVGAGTVAPRLSAMSWRKVLPCVGVGYRWEFKRLSNVRLDFGIGRGETSFIFNINEAF